MLLNEIFDLKPIPVPPQVTTMYHCTLARHMDSILTQGLIANKGQNYPKIYGHPSNKDINYKPGVWLATTPGYSQSWIHEIAVDYEPAVILEVNVSNLNQELFIADPYIPNQGSRIGDKRFAYLYQASIPRAAIKPWGEIRTLDSTYNDNGKDAAYYGRKQVRQIRGDKEWQAFFDRIKKFFNLPDAV